MPTYCQTIASSQTAVRDKWNIMKTRYLILQENRQIAGLIDDTTIYHKYAFYLPFKVDNRNIGR